MPQTVVVSEHDASTNLALTTAPFSPADRAYIQFPCSSLTGTLDGVWTVYGMSGAGGKSIIGTVTLDMADNSNDVHSVNFSGSPEELAFEYAANGCEGGTTGVVVSRNKQ